jgi:hypothetical protein
VARRRPPQREPEGLLGIIKRIEVAAAQARAEAADAPVDPWDLLDPNPAISEPAWKRWMTGAPLAE